MIRLLYSKDLPTLAYVRQEEDRIGIVINPYYQLLLTTEKRQNLFNHLMGELERHGGGMLTLVDGEGHDTVVVDLTDLRQRREIAARIGSAVGISN